MKRVAQLWGKRYRRRWILWKPRFLDALNSTQFVEFGKVRVSTRDLRKAISDIPTEDILVRTNGGLQLEQIQRYTVQNPADPRIRKFAHRLVKNGASRTVKANGKNIGVGVILKIKIRPYGNKKRG